MKLITTFELAGRSESELSNLFMQVSHSLTRSRRGTPERRTALATLENISRARVARMTGP